ncbi:hypothetical protein O181_015678 [Austropuccinia psidii MF-1]|uniref:Uncharacterized protein n=1 Tax=Austropuccinia psidii MF-1 TaxID=1389203 RepID=A0A9Q3C3P0_9BASI|nr:hypothetical protein [Austropuccinia psidii MF-1]
MEKHSGKSFPPSHSPSNSTKTSNQRTRHIWMKYLSSTSSSNTYSNGELKQRCSTLLQTGKNLGKLPEDMSKRDIFQRTYGNYQDLEPQKAVKTLIREGSQDKGESSQNTGYRRGMELERAFSDSFGLASS